MEQEGSGFKLRHFCGLISAFMFFFSFINMMQFGNVGDSGTFTFLYVATVPIFIVDLLVVTTIYCPTEHAREVFLRRNHYCIPISIVLVTSALHITASFDGILKMYEDNE